MVDVIAVAKSVLARRHAAVLVPLYNAGMKAPLGESDWLPKPNYCHDNVAIWVSRSPHHKHVRGYVIFDLRGIGVWQVQPHSVVETEEGKLIDITPSGASQMYPFVRHIGTDEEFLEMMRAMRVEIPESEV